MQHLKITMYSLLIIVRCVNIVDSAQVALRLLRLFLLFGCCCCCWCSYCCFCWCLAHTAVTYPPHILVVVDDAWWWCCCCFAGIKICWMQHKMAFIRMNISRAKGRQTHVNNQPSKFSSSILLMFSCSQPRSSRICNCGVSYFCVFFVLFLPRLNPMHFDCVNRHMCMLCIRHMNFSETKLFAFKHLVCNRTDMR